MRKNWRTPKIAFLATVTDCHRCYRNGELTRPSTNERRSNPAVALATAANVERWKSMAGNATQDYRRRQKRENGSRRKQTDEKRAKVNNSGYSGWARVSCDSSEVIFDGDIGAKHLSAMSILQHTVTDKWKLILRQRPRTFSTWIVGIFLRI